MTAVQFKKHCRNFAVLELLESAVSILKKIQSVHALHNVRHHIHHPIIPAIMAPIPKNPRTATRPIAANKNTMIFTNLLSMVFYPIIALVLPAKPAALSIRARKFLFNGGLQFHKVRLANETLDNPAALIDQ